MIIMFLFLLGPSNIAIALSLCASVPLCLCEAIPGSLGFKLTNKTGHSQIQKGPAGMERGQYPLVDENIE
jgi:hypothetical protein